VTFSTLVSINDGVNSLLGCIRNKPGLRIPELSEQLHVPAKTIERWIKNYGTKTRLFLRALLRPVAILLTSEKDRGETSGTSIVLLLSLFFFIPVY